MGTRRREGRGQEAERLCQHTSPSRAPSEQEAEARIAKTTAKLEAERADAHEAARAAAAEAARELAAAKEEGEAVQAKIQVVIEETVELWAEVVSNLLQCERWRRGAWACAIPRHACLCSGPTPRSLPHSLPTGAGAEELDEHRTFTKQDVLSLVRARLEEVAQAPGAARLAAPARWVPGACSVAGE